MAALDSARDPCRPPVARGNRLWPLLLVVLFGKNRLRCSLGSVADPMTIPLLQAVPEWAKASTYFILMQG